MNKIVEKILQHKMKELIVNYLKDSKLIDVVVQNGDALSGIRISELPSEMGIKLDYSSLHIHMNNIKREGRVYTIQNTRWVLPHRILNKYGRVKENKPDRRIEGAMDKFIFDVGFDPDTGDPLVEVIDSELSINYNIRW